jgi:hypothetical protein
MFRASTHSCPTTKNLEALSYPVGMTRLDLTLKMIGADGSESTEHRTVEIPDHPDALHRVLHILHTELRVTTGDQALPRQNARAPG